MAAPPLRRVIGSALASPVLDVITAAAPHPAGIAPLRRMVGYAHPVRPSLRAGTAALRVPAAGLLQAAPDPERIDPVTGGAARHASTAGRAARGRAPAITDRNPAGTAPSTAAAPTTTARRVPTSGSTGVPTSGSTGAEAPSRSATVLPLHAQSPQGQNPQGQTLRRQPAVLTQSTVNRSQSETPAGPRGVALSSVRSLRGSRTPVTELRPSTSVHQAASPGVGAALRTAPAGHGAAGHGADGGPDDEAAAYCGVARKP
ncbi:MAG: hypothetical protein ACRDNT_09785 [Streptosporangiaceae bacterium]